MSIHTIQGCQSMLPSMLKFIGYRCLYLREGGCIKYIVSIFFFGVTHWQLVPVLHNHGLVLKMITVDSWTWSMPRRAMNHLPLLQRKSIAFLDVYTREKNPLWILCTLVPQLIPLRTITPLGTMWYEESTPWVKVTIVPCKYWRNWATSQWGELC